MAVVNGQFTRTEGFQPGQDRNYPRFFLHDEQDHIASEREGRPIYKSEERVEIIMPGNPLTKPVMKVTDEHRLKWPEQYKAFKSGQEMAADGTPLEQWPILKRSQVLELKALGHLTVDHVATMDDLACQRIGIGGTRLRDLARGYLDEAQAQAILTKATADNQRMTERMDLLEARNKELSRLLEETHSRLQTLHNSPHPIAATAPMLLDPVEQAKGMQRAEAPAQSSLNDLPEPRRRKEKPA